MSDTDENIPPSENDQDVHTDSDTLMAMVGHGLAHIPAPIQANALKALGALCSTGVNVLTGELKNFADRRKAISDARIKSIRATGDSLADKIDVPEQYAELAMIKNTENIVKEQLRTDKVAAMTAEKLNNDPEFKESPSQNKQTETPEISDDIIEKIRTSVSHISSEHAQELFARILAGEIKRPGSFSLRTIDILSTMETEIAELFTKFAALCLTIRRNIFTKSIADGRVCALGNAGQNSLLDFGLPYSKLRLLSEYGLVDSDLNSQMPLNGSLVKDRKIEFPIFYANKFCVFEPNDSTKPTSDIIIRGPHLTNAGREILPIIDIKENYEYTKKIRAFLIENYNVNLSEIPGAHFAGGNVHL